MSTSDKTNPFKTIKGGNKTNNIFISATGRLFPPRTNPPTPKPNSRGPWRCSARRRRRRPRRRPGLRVRSPPAPGGWSAWDWRSGEKREAGRWFGHMAIHKYHMVIYNPTIYLFHSMMNLFYQLTKNTVWVKQNVPPVNIPIPTK